MTDIIRGGADQRGVGNTAHLHGVIGDKAVAALEKLQRCFTFADAGITGEQYALAVNLHQNAVDSGAGRQLQTQLGIELCRHMGGIFRRLEKRNGVLPCQLQKKRAEGKFLRDNDRLRAAGQKALQTAAQRFRRKGLQVGKLGASDHIDPCRNKALKKTGKGKTGAHQLSMADQNLLLGLRVIQHLQVQIPNELFQCYGVLM